jgi:hypothetical protein
MAIIHRTSLNPSKLKLLAAWLPGQPWYRGNATPQLAKVGGFRIDDPAGAVGIELMVVTDSSGESAVTYLTPMTYHAASLDGAGQGLIGTTEHGVLGTRWVYDAVHDPVFIAALAGLVQGRAEPQAQGVSDTPDPSVHVRPVAAGVLTETCPARVTNGVAYTDLQIEATAADMGDGTDSGIPAGLLAIRLNRVLVPEGSADPAADAGEPCVIAGWEPPGGQPVRGVLATARWQPAAEQMRRTSDAPARP